MPQMPGPSPRVYPQIKSAATSHSPRPGPGSCAERRKYEKPQTVIYICSRAQQPAAVSCAGLVAGFIGVDEIRMLLKKIPSLIILFNFYIYIILVLKINNSIISALKIMNLNILLLNFLKYSIAEYASKPCSECAWCKSGPVNVFPTSPHWRLCWERMYQYIPAILHCRKYWEDPAFFPGRNSDFQNSMGNLKL